MDSAHHYESSRADALKSLDEKVSEIQNGGDVFGVGPMNREMARYAAMVESGDARPAAPLQEAYSRTVKY